MKVDSVGVVNEGTDVEYTVDQLAAAAGTLSSTVRMYQARGLLARPRREGRVAFYNGGHLHRLGQIAELQRRGHSLAGIAELFSEADRGTPIASLLTSHLGATEWSAPRMVALSPMEFTQRFGPSTPTSADIGRSIQLGLMVLDGDQVVADERFIDAGARLAALGVPIGRILDEWEVLDASMAITAQRFAALFREHLWLTLTPDAPLSEVTGMLDQLAVLARAVTSLALERRLSDAAAQFADDVTTPSTPSTPLP